MGMSYRERKTVGSTSKPQARLDLTSGRGVLLLTRNSGGPEVQVKRQSSRRTGHRAGK